MLRRNYTIRVPAKHDAGMTLVELIVVLTLAGILLSIGASYMKPTASRGILAGRLVEGAFKQARAKAMVTTGAQRVRPTTDSALEVESAASCAAGSWTAEPDLRIELPDGVRFADTEWSVCFNSRGIASDALTIRLSDALFGERDLEVLLGGVTRWRH